MPLHGEADNASMLNRSQELFELRENLRSYPISNIHSMDATGLFFRFVPRTSFVLGAEGKRSVRGIKAMCAKEKVTTNICTNADGSDKIDIAIIGRLRTRVASVQKGLRFRNST